MNRARDKRFYKMLKLLRVTSICYRFYEIHHKSKKSSLTRTSSQSVLNKSLIQQFTEHFDPFEDLGVTTTRSSNNSCWIAHCKLRSLVVVTKVLLSSEIDNFLYVCVYKLSLSGFYVCLFRSYLHYYLRNVSVASYLQFLGVVFDGL